jgi:hypothetical protein
MKILLFGHVPTSWDECWMSQQRLGYGMYAALSQHPVELFVRNIISTDPVWPIVDVVVLVLYHSEYEWCEIARQKTQAKFVIGLESAWAKGPDYNFVFDKAYEAPHACCLTNPIPDVLCDMSHEEKIQNSVLLDYKYHAVEVVDRTEEIAYACKALAESGKYEFHRIAHQHHPLFPHENRFHRKPYLKYINRLKHFERFVVTHSECYAFGVLDAIAMNVEVFAPENFMPKCLFQDLSIKTFKDTDELLEMIERPYSPPVRPQFTPYSEIAKLLVAKSESVING